MDLRRPPRIPAFPYLGRYCYLLTMCTFRRQRCLNDPEVFEFVRTSFLHTAHIQRFAVHAYCAMPDHLHLLAEGTSEDCHLPTFVSRFKQRTGFRYGRSRAERLWQEGYYDHVLRTQEPLPRVVRYILENPVRRGFVASPEQWPWSGTPSGLVEDLLSTRG